MSDDVTTNATNPDMARDDAATQQIHERLLSLGAQWRSRYVPTKRLAAHVSTLAMRDHAAMPGQGYPPQQEEFVLTNMPVATQHRIAPRRYAISAITAVVVIALLSAAFFVVTRKAPGTHPPTATQILPSTTTALTKATDLPFTATSAASSSLHPLLSLHMFDATTGWAQTDQKILRTTDGGAHWQNVTPPGITLPLQPSQALIYTALDATTAWASDGKTIYRTTDAGQTWQSATPPVEKSINYLTFADGIYGWAVADVGYAAGHEGLNLWRTSDGGSSWTQVMTTGTTDIPGKLPFTGNKSAPVFINATTGWFGGYEPVDNFIYFYVTHDGGMTWRQQSLPPPRAQNFEITTNTPIFVNSQDGVLPTDSACYVTHDGGTSWSIAGRATINLNVADFLDMQHWWTVSGQNNNTLTYTSDGGQHWATITPGGAFNTVSYLDFISPASGFATAGGITDLPATLLHTTNGGHTWQQISYQVG